jgi:hypothetical protein
MNRKIIASLLNNANHLDNLGFHKEANTLTKLAQGYQREVGPPTSIQVGPRGSFDSNSMGNEINPRDRLGFKITAITLFLKCWVTGHLAIILKPSLSLGVLIS